MVQGQELEEGAVHWVVLEEEVVKRRVLIEGKVLPGAGAERRNGPWVGAGAGRWGWSTTGAGPGGRGGSWLVLVLEERVVQGLVLAVGVVHWLFLE